MRPKTDADHQVLDEIDKSGLKETKKRTEEWAPTILAKLNDVTLPEDEIRFLANRNKQIWKPLLAMGAIIKPSWYERALRSASFFTDGQEIDKTLTHNILRGSYRIFRTGDHPDRIHGLTMLEALYELGIPSWLDQSQLARIMH
jgi:hypothetical protein